MAQKIQVLLTDDIDGSEASETLTYGLDGKTYEIDLNKKNADKLRNSLGSFISHSRRVTGGPGRRPRSSHPGVETRRDPAQTKAIREWALANGHKVSERGRIPAPVEAAYEASH
jgi:hypothetical protein